MLDPSTLVQLEALAPSGPFRARTRETVADVTGAPVAELSLVPPVYLHRTIGQLRAAQPLPVPERLEALRRAGELFRDAELAGIGPADYRTIVTKVSGLARRTIDEAAERVAAACPLAYDEAIAALPATAALDLADARVKRGAGLWVRRGEVFGVLAAGNHPAVHTHWLQALALGYRVALRPSRREPFTAHRLVAALREAGFEGHVTLLPTDHAGADELVSAVDLAMVYGGDDVMRKFRGHPSVLPQGPGRSKMLITADVDWSEQLDLIVHSISRHGGVSCTSTTAIFVEQDARAFAEALAARLAALPGAAPQEDDALLPVQTAEQSARLRDHLERTAAGATAVLGADTVVHDLGDGSAVLRPAVHLLDRADDPRAGVELPFPNVWVAPWSAADGVEPLADTLALTALTDDQELVLRLLAHPGIRNVYVGAHPTTLSAPGMPHDGYLGDFLMQTKGVITQ